MLPTDPLTQSINVRTISSLVLYVVVNSFPSWGVPCCSAPNFKPVIKIRQQVLTAYCLNIHTVALLLYY